MLGLGACVELEQKSIPVIKNPRLYHCTTWEDLLPQSNCVLMCLYYLLSFYQISYRTILKP